ncbi:hypothetical protein GFL84_35820, partial [Rhizobium leguminosarum bv. viciae]|nr:hypothetical protein [Rhizobium leguminosarum bv. viciae]
MVIGSHPDAGGVAQSITRHATKANGVYVTSGLGRLRGCLLIVHRLHVWLEVTAYSVILGLAEDPCPLPVEASVDPRVKPEEDGGWGELCGQYG